MTATILTAPCGCAITGRVVSACEVIVDPATGAWRRDLDPRTIRNHQRAARRAWKPKECAR